MYTAIWSGDESKFEKLFSCVPKARMFVEYAAVLKTDSKNIARKTLRKYVST